MTAYIIADIDKWVPSYAASVHELVHKHGVRRVPLAQRQHEVTGTRIKVRPDGLPEFPLTPRPSSTIPNTLARKAGSESQFTMIDDTDIAGTIPYLPKG